MDVRPGITHIHTHTSGIVSKHMDKKTLHVHASKTSKCVYVFISAYSTQKHRQERLLAATVPCTHRTEATSTLNCDLVAKNLSIFQHRNVGVIFFSLRKLYLYLNTQGLCVTELLFRGFWLIDCCVKDGGIRLALLCFLSF